MILLKNCRLVPELTEGWDGERADVLLRGELIEGIFAPGTAPQAEETLDLAGATLLPGLIDLHAHLYFTDSDFAALAARSPLESMTRGLLYAQTFLRWGYTTVRDCGGADYVNIAIRDAIRRGAAPGPDIISCGLILTPTAKGNSTFGSLYCELDDPAQMMRAVRQDVVHGAEFIKYMATGSVANLGGEPGELVTTREELAALVRAARSCGTYVAAHCHGRDGILLCAETGVYTIEHASYMDEACVEAVLRSGSATVPTLAAAYPFWRDFDEARDGGSELAVQCRDAFEAMVRSLRMAYDAGIPVGWGQDCSMSSFLATPGMEFLARRESGLSCVQLLRQATVDSARIAHLEDSIGTVRAGKRANVFAVRGRPDEDIAAMREPPLAVFCGGRRFV
ncbi:MAG: amidohydrolase family protein [Clostridia bacterium]|nr:amidohydrolase family protein [Clostridia bacterium]